MIRINLLATDRGGATKKKAGAGVTAAQRVTIGAALILLSTVVGVGWWFWSLRTESIQLDEEIARAEVEAQQLRSVLAQVQKFETEKARLQQRVSLIEQLRRGQTGPVHHLDEVSSAPGSAVAGVDEPACGRLHDGRADDLADRCLGFRGQPAGESVVRRGRTARLAGVIRLRRGTSCGSRCGPLRTLRRPRRRRHRRARRAAGSQRIQLWISVSANCRGGDR